MSNPRAVSAHTTYPNTPETDARLTVLHTVKMVDGTTETVMATDPIDAINKFNKA